MEKKTTPPECSAQTQGDTPCSAVQAVGASVGGVVKHLGRDGKLGPDARPVGRPEHLSSDAATALALYSDAKLRACLTTLCEDLVQVGVSDFAFLRKHRTLFGFHVHGPTVA